MNATNIAIQYHSSTLSAEGSFMTSEGRRLRKRVAKVPHSLPKLISSQRETKVVEVASRLVGKYPLTLDERIKEVKEKLSKMSQADKWKLIKESFGMWENYPQDWIEKLRKGILNIDHMIDSNNRSYVIFSR